MPDDVNVESGLRELLRDPSWSLRPRPDAQVLIRRAARRQRVKTASFTAGTGAIATAGVAVALTVLGGGAPGTPIINPASAPSTAQRPAATGQMPLVIGLHLPKAKAEVSAAVRHPDISVHYLNQGFPVGIVLVQIPSGGTRLRPGSHVTLEVSNRASGQMPRVVGLTLSQAEAAISAAVRDPDISVQRIKSSIPAGTVLYQAPRAGTRLRPGSHITLKVSINN